MNSENPGLFLNEVCQMVYQATGTSVSGSTICRMLSNGLSRKKMQQVAKQRCIEFRALFLSRVLGFNLDMFVWIDETGSDAKTSIRKFGYSILGEAPIVSICPWQISAIVSDGIIDI